MGICKVPDPDLFPARYAGVRTVLFRAGLELRLLHAGTWCAAVLVRLGVIRNRAAHAPMLRRLSERFIRFGSDVAGMTVELGGTDLAGSPLHLRWWLCANAGDGLQVSVTPAAVLAQQRVHGKLTATGAHACVVFLTLNELISSFDGYAIHCGVETLG